MLLLFAFATLAGLSIINQARYTTILLVPGALLATLLSRKLKFRIGIFEKQWIAFLMWGTLTAPMATETEIAYGTQLRIAFNIAYGVLIVTYIGNSQRQLQKVIRALAQTATIVLLYYLFEQDNLGQLTQERLDNSRLDPNTYGYFGVIAIVCLQLNSKIREKASIKMIALTTAISVLAALVTIAAASRGGFAMVSAAIILFSLNNMKSQKLGQFPRGSTLVLIILAGLLSTIEFRNTNLYSRFLQLQDGESSREYHLRKAVEVGMNNPIKGVGGGNYSKVEKDIEMGAFSHNTFAEAFASYGFVGLALLVSSYASLYRKASQVSKQWITTVYIAITLHAMYGFFYVTYLSPEFTALLFTTKAFADVQSQSAQLEADI